MALLTTRASQVAVHKIDRFDSLMAMSDSWTDLLATSTNNQPVSTPQWLLTWWEIYAHAQSRQLSCLEFWDNHQLIGLAPLSWRRTRHKGLVPVRRLEFLGCGEAMEDECCSYYSGLISRPGYEHDVACALVDHLTGSTAPVWDHLHLEYMNGENELPALLRDAFRAKGYNTTLLPHEIAFYIPLPSTWEAYLEGLSRKRRYFVRKTLRTFEDWAGSPGVVHRSQHLEDLHRGFHVLKDLHTERWEAAGGSGVFASERFTSFHTAVLGKLQAIDAAQLVWLTVNGRPVAALYEIIWDNKVLAYQSGRAIGGVPDDVRPGIVLHIHALKQAIEDGRAEYDLLCGAFRYKRQLASVERQLVKLDVWRPSLVSRACEAVDQLEQHARTLKRSLEHRLQQRPRAHDEAQTDRPPAP